MSISSHVSLEPSWALKFVWHFCRHVPRYADMYTYIYIYTIYSIEYIFVHIYIYIYVCIENLKAFENIMLGLIVELTSQVICGAVE